MTMVADSRPSTARAGDAMQAVSRPACAARRETRCGMAARMLLGALFMVLGACQAQGVKSDAKAKTPAVGQTVMLTLHGYNYTDHYIDSYSVNGAGGGNLFVSSPTTGGGGGACCVRWLVGRALPVKVHIRWESSECLYTKRVDGEDFPRAKSFYSEADVWLKGPIPADPQYFETHFYPDGHIEVAVTDDYSMPRLKLPEKNDIRPGAKPWPKCTPEQMKQGEG
jgi:hypothetical protein